MGGRVCKLTGVAAKSLEVASTFSIYYVQGKSNGGWEGSWPAPLGGSLPSPTASIFSLPRRLYEGGGEEANSAIRALSVLLN